MRWLIDPEPAGEWRCVDEAIRLADVSASLAEAYLIAYPLPLPAPEEREQGEEGWGVNCELFFSLMRKRMASCGACGTVSDTLFDQIMEAE